MSGFEGICTSCGSTTNVGEFVVEHTFLISKDKAPGVILPGSTSARLCRSCAKNVKDLIRESGRITFGRFSRVGFYE